MNEMNEGGNMKILMTVFALFLASGAASARTISSPIPPVLKCGEKTDGKDPCYVMPRGIPTTVAENQVLTFVDVQDSRCPLDVLCVWAGFVVTSFTLESADGSTPPQSFRLSLDTRYEDTDVYVDEATGLTVVLKAVTQHLVSE